MGGDSRNSFQQAAPSKPLGELSLRPVLELPFQVTLAGDVLGGPWLELIVRTDTRILAIDLESSRVHTPWREFALGPEALLDLDGDGKKDLLLTRVSQLSSPGFIGVTGEGRLLFDVRFPLGPWTHAGSRANFVGDRFFAAIFASSGPEPRRLFAWRPGQPGFQWEYTLGPLVGVISSFTGRDGITYLTADTTSPCNRMYGYGRVKDRDHYTADVAPYIFVLDSEGREVFIKSFHGRGRMVNRFWNGDLLSLYVEDRIPNEVPAALMLHDLQGRELAVQRWEPGTSSAFAIPHQRSILLVDLDLDGRDEAVVGRDDIGEIVVYRHPGLEVERRRALGSAVPHYAGDLDGDGFDEILAASSEEILVLGPDLETESRLRCPGVGLISLADLDRDGYLEVIARSADSTWVFSTVDGPLRDAAAVLPEIGPEPAAEALLDPEESSSPPIDAFDFAYRVEELFPENAGDLADPSARPERRVGLLRATMLDSRALVMETVFLLCRSTSRHAMHRSRKGLLPQARLMADLALELWDDPHPGRMVDRHSTWSGEELAVWNQAFNDWIQHETRLRAGDTVGAMDRLARAAEQYRGIGEAYNESRTLVRLAELGLELGRFGQALAAADRAIALKRDWYDPLGLSQAERVRAEVLRATGSFDDALAALTRSREYAQEDRTGTLLAEAETALGALYVGAGLPDTARVHLEEAARLREDGNRYDEVARISRMLAEIAIDAGRLDEAEQLLVRAQKIATDLQLQALLGQVLLTRARHEARRAPVVAYRTLLAAARIGRSAEIPVLAVNAAAHLAALDLRNGDVDLALRRAGRAGDLASSLGLQDLAWRSGLVAARALESQGNLPDALRLYERSIEELDNYRAEVTADRVRSGFLGARMEPFEAALRVIADLQERDPGSGHADRALAVVERAHARALADSLVQGAFATPVGPGGEALRRRISLLVGRLGNPEISEEQREALKGELENARCEYDGSCLKDRSDPVAPGLLRSAVPRSAGEIQDYLSRTGLTLLAFHAGEESSFGLLVRDGRAHLARLPAVDRLAPLCLRFRALLEGAPSWDATLEPGRALAEALLGPFKDLLPERGATVAILPDGPLHGVPLGALPHPGTGEPLLAGYSLFVVPSISVLMSLDERLGGELAAGWTLDFAGFGDPRVDDLLPSGGPLSAAREEVGRLAALFPTAKSVAFSGMEASTERLKSISPGGARAIHLATHAEWFEGTESPAILLSPSATEDGVLTVQEIAALSIPAQVVYLSGCRTGRGRELPGEGVLGLSRAWLGAGASAVIASLWPVEDAPSARVAQGFYHHWLGGRSPAEALSRARREMYLAGARPREWAGLLLMGDGRGADYRSSLKQAEPTSSPSAE